MYDYSKIPADDVIEKTIKNLKDRGITVFLVETKKDALEKVKSMIPDGVTVMNGSSATLEEIGFVDYLKEGQSWSNLHIPALMEKNEENRIRLMRESQLADYFLGSINAIAETGELVSTDASGSRVGAYPYSAGKLILVSGANKIEPTLDIAMERIRKYVLPLESVRVKEVYGMEGSFLGKTVIIHREIIPERINLILVKEKLGY